MSKEAKIVQMRDAATVSKKVQRKAKFDELVKHYMTITVSYPKRKV